MAPPRAEPVLAGTIVVERGHRLSTAAVGHLLASLGATVLRVETPAESAQRDAMPVQDRNLRAAGKQRIQIGGDVETQWRQLHAMADIVLLDPPAADAPDAAILDRLIHQPDPTKIVCVLSPAGIALDTWQDVPEPLLQALGGAMAVTGAEGGPPEFVRVPIVELGAAIMAATGVLGALRVRRRDGAGQVVDVSLIEAASDHLRLHLPILGVAAPNGYRQGCGHPICCPWNAYQAKDGWVLICSTSQGQWESLLDAIGHPELKGDPRYGSAQDRRARIAEVDGMVQAWVGTLTRAQVVAAIDAAGVPAGEVPTIPQVTANLVLRQRGTVIDIEGSAVLGTPIGLSRTPAARGMSVTAPTTTIPALPANPLPPRAETPKMPLAGIRVVEITRYTAGPLAGMLLAGLGAEVIKIESPGGEEPRRWTPQFDGASGYFINHNAGKRSVTLDLRKPAGQRHLLDLVGQSDVFLQNLRPGVMDKIGLGGPDALKRQPRLIHATISGFGLGGPELPALDTVIQGLGGLPSLVGTGPEPCRVGFSIADQVSGHITALAIIAAIVERDRSGHGQIVDTAMADAIAWLTQLAWPDGRSAIGPACRLDATDGYVAVAADEVAIRAVLPEKPRTRAALVTDLRRLGFQAAPVLEPLEVYAQDIIQARHSVYTMATQPEPAPVLTLPVGLTLTPALRPTRLHALGEDNANLLETSAG